MADQNTSTRPHLLSLLNDLRIHDYNDTGMRAALTLTFAGFLRIGEFTYRPLDLQMGPAFPNWFLTKSSIRLIHHYEHIEPTLPASKTDSFRQGIHLIIAGSHEEACPVRAMKELLVIDTHLPETAPQFCVGTTIYKRACCREVTRIGDNRRSRTSNMEWS